MPREGEPGEPEDFVRIWSRLDTAGKEQMLDAWKKRLSMLRGELEAGTAPVDERLRGIRREMDELLVKIARIIEGGPETREFSKGESQGQGRLSALNAQLLPLMALYRQFQESRAGTVDDFLPLLKEAEKAVALIRASLSGEGA